MKKFIAMLALVASLATFAPSSAEARDTRGHTNTYHSSHTIKRAPLKKHFSPRKTVLVRVRVVVGHDRRHRSIYAWRYVHRAVQHNHR